MKIFPIRCLKIFLIMVFPMSVFAGNGSDKRAVNSAVQLYVATTGSDTNPGTRPAPFKTILKASQVAEPGATVYVAPGSYPGGFQTDKSGTESNRIRYVSEFKWSARIIPLRDSASTVAWDNRGSYVDIDGFEFDGSDVTGQGATKWRIGIYNGGSYNRIKNNHIYNIARKVPCTNSGGSAIISDHYYHGVASDVVNNVVHNIGYSGCNFIHGIYISTTGSVKNNLVYQVGAAAIHLWHDARDVIIENNVAFRSHSGIIIGGGDFYHLRGPADNIHASNNIVFENTYGITESGSLGSNIGYTDNLVYQNGTNWKLKKDAAQRRIP